MAYAKLGTVLLLCFSLSACGKEQVDSSLEPAELTRDAVGYYCGMIVIDHPGPKAQIHLSGRQDPIWFTSVRDAIAFSRLPEEPRNIAAIYVHDMGLASDWTTPDASAWIRLDDAVFVIESEKRGGMGAKEAVPFRWPSHAKTFIEEHGGRLVALNDIPDSYVLGEAEWDDALPDENDREMHEKHMSPRQDMETPHLAHEMGERS